MHSIIPLLCKLPRWWYSDGRTNKKEDAMAHRSKKAIEARIKAQKGLRYRTWARSRNYQSTTPSPFVVVRAQGTKGYDVVHRLDCPELRTIMDARGTLLFVRRFRDLRSVSRGRHQAFCKCRPEPNDAYYQCLVCGTFIPGLPKKFNATCQCGRLTVDPMAPIGPDSPVTVTCAPGEYRFLLPRGVTMRKLNE